MIKAVRGTRDLLPPETALWNFVEAAVRDVFRVYNFQEIRTPIFEETQLFSRAVGEETDVVSKEMYTWFNSRDPQRAFEHVWLDWLRRKRNDLYVALEPYEADVGEFDYQVEVNGIRTIVQVSYQPDAGVRARMAEHRKDLLEEEPNSAPPNFILAYPDFQDSRVRQLQQDKVDWIEFQPVDTEQWLRSLPGSLTLRPENTAGIVRAYIEHKMWDRGLNKFYAIGPMFRRERPQKGRYRQFNQIDAEIIGPAASGSESPARDAELLEMIATLLDRLGIEGWTLQLNSVGCANDRAKYNEALRKALEPVAPKMCADCQRRAITNPLRVFDCKVPEDQPIIETLPRISQYLDEPCRKHFEEVQAILKAIGIPFQLNDRLVRGLDYYTRTAFEFTHGALGAQNAILGGGRYDGLSESLGGPSAPGIGFAIGEDRLVLALKQSAESVRVKPDVYIAPLGEGMDREAARLARQLRRHDIVVELGDEKFRLKKSFEMATKAGAQYILIVGENEVKADTFALKQLESGEQASVPRGELAGKIQAGR